MVQEKENKTQNRKPEEKRTPDVIYIFFLSKLFRRNTRSLNHNRCSPTKYSNILARNNERMMPPGFDQKERPLTGSPQYATATRNEMRQ